MRIESPYHDGERLVQERAGERFKADHNGSVIDTTIPGAAMGFITQQAMVVLATADHLQRPWVSLLIGLPGFVQAQTPQDLTIDLTRGWPHPHDPAWDNLRQDPRAGMLLIELATRRRLRINGRMTTEGVTLAMAVERAYPNCPKYIQRRHLPANRTRKVPNLAAPRRGTSLNDAQQEWIASADTLFVASMHPVHGVDASHRGGRPGFVQRLDPQTLRIPDYPGNSMFNTLGNFATHAQGGLLFPDFDGQRALHLAGEVTLRWDLADPDGHTGGTGRYWDFAIHETLELAAPVEVPWEFLDPSPFNP